jgi:hypothetical protein
MATIAIDIDSTLYDFETPAREGMLKLYKETGDPVYKEGAYHPWTEWRSPADVLGIDRWLEVIGLCHQADVIESQRPFEGAVETCNALLIEGHNLLYISNRATESEDATRRWLVTNHFFGGHIPRVHEDQYVTLVVTMGDKRPFIKDCQYLIDDRLKTCVDFVHDPYWQVEHGFRGEEGSLERKAFVKAYGYNQAGTDLPGLYIAPTWAGLNEYLVTKDVLSQEAFIPLGLARV